MEKIYVAKSYESYEKVSEPFEKSGRKYITVRKTCDRCGGTGVYGCRVENNMVVPHPAYNGVCLKCGGSGYIIKDVRVYTESEHLAQERLQKKKDKEREQLRLEKELEKEKTKEAREKKAKLQWFEKNGFDENGLTYCVFGEDTYAIKDWLKEQGCKYSPILKWHCKEPLDVPCGYGMIGFSFDEIYEWDSENFNGFFKEESKEIVDRKFKEAEGPSYSEYVGEVGERLRNETAIYKSARGFESRYGWTNIYTFQIGEDVLVWFTQKNLVLEKGCLVDLTGTVKKHEEFRGVKTTQLSRCIIKKIEE